MYLIVGLGNPGDEYKNTRHNVGFEVIDIIAEKYNITLNREKFKGMYGDGMICGQKVILLKPLTYMNLSGESLIQFANFYKIPCDDIIVIYDDISLDVGRIRIREKGSAGGHNGIKSIISCLGTDVFPRVKVGVGAPKGSLVSHVLGRFIEEDKPYLKKAMEASCEAAVEIIKNGVKSSMNDFNGFNAVPK